MQQFFRLHGEDGPVGGACDRLGKVLFCLLQLHDLFLDGVLCDELVHLHRVLLADALRTEGFTEDEVEGIYFRNAMRFFEENL